MTDARIEAVARALCDAQGWCPDGNEITPRNFPSMDKNWKVYEEEVQIAVSAADAAAWRPISEAKKDGSPILAKLRNNIYPPVTDESSLRARADYRWNGLTIVLRHPGLANDGFDMGWNVAAPVGHGGFPDDWIEGWQPLPATPTKEATP
ncbi:hypothetical protein [Acetobacter pasteurianus]|uniref:hypothetical protein n=1 Tax=Acetobacter pasteurianus TaxID=438 RepID=UPI003D10C5CA